MGLQCYNHVSAGHELNHVVHVLYIKTCNNNTHASAAAPDASACSVGKKGQRVYVNACMHACMHTYIHTDIHTLHYITLHNITLHYIT